MKWNQATSAVIFIFLLAITTCGWSQSSSDPDMASTQAVTVKGCAALSVYGGDEPRTRDEAITRAKVQALEEAGGVYVDKQVLLQNTLLLHSYVKNETDGFMRGKRLIREWKEGDNLCVEIEAWIVKGDEAKKSALRSLISNTTIIVDIPETYNEEEVFTRSMEESLEDGISAAGFRLLDKAQAEVIREKEKKALQFDGDPESAKRLGLRYLSNLVVKGYAKCKDSQINGKIHSGRTNVRVKGVVSDTAAIQFPFRKSGVKGFGLDFERACEESRENAAKEAVGPVVEGLGKYLNANKRIINVNAHNISSGTQYRKLENFIKTFPWVEDMETGSYNEKAQTATFEVPYKERTVYLATRFDRSADYHLVSFTSNGITIRVK